MKKELSLTIRIIYMLLGTVLTGVGIAFYRLTALGNDSFSAFNFSLYELTNIPYSICNFLVSLVLFIPMIIFERKRINVGTIVNIIGVGLVVDFVLWLAGLMNLEVSTYNVFIRFLIAAIGIIIEVFGISMYLTADLGIAPIDSVPLIFESKLHVSFKIGRWISDGALVLSAFIISNLILKGHAVGVFTLFALIFVSPILNHFNKVLSGYYRNKKENNI